MNRTEFTEFLRPRIRLLDGAASTRLADDPGPVPVESLNLEDPARVVALHRSYRQAGAEIIRSNTFGGNRARLAAAGFADRTVEVNRRGVELAREAAAGEALVAAAIGPAAGGGGAEERYGEQRDGLLAGGPDLILMETFTDCTEAASVLLWLRASCRLPIGILMAPPPVVEAGAAAACAAAAGTLGRAGADLVGFNCSAGPEPVGAALAATGGSGSGRLAAVPSAGLPAGSGPARRRLLGPVPWAEATVSLTRFPLRIVGGCCGTTPEHTRALRERLPAGRPGSAAAGTSVIIDIDRDDRQGAG